MADSVYDQALAIVATDVKTLADAVDTALTTESTIPVTAVNWDDLAQNIISIAYDFNAVESASRMTSEADMRGYPAYVVMAVQKRDLRDTLYKNLSNIKEDIRRYFNHRRRMSSISLTGVREQGCRVRDGGLRPPRSITDGMHVHVITVMMWFLESRTS